MPLALWIGGAPLLALLLGYDSHLIAVAATKNGIPLWYPHGARRHLLPKPWRITTGSQAEEIVFIVTAAFALLLLLQSLRLPS